jgi:hypothetical protein
LVFPLSPGAVINLGIWRTGLITHKLFMLGDPGCAGARPGEASPPALKEALPVLIGQAG